MNVGPAVSSRTALQQFFACADFVRSKTSISRRSGPDSASPFKGSRRDRLVFMLSRLSANQVARKHGWIAIWKKIRQRQRFSTRKISWTFLSNSGQAVRRYSEPKEIHSKALTGDSRATIFGR